LEVNDYVFVRSVPEWQLYRTVIISGEVKYPGTYTIKRGETISSLLERAGGYADRAYLRGAVFIRERVRELQQKGLEEMAQRLERELLSESSIRAGSSVTPEEVAARQVALQQKQKLIETLKAQKALGRMTVRLGPVRLLKGSEYDIELEDRDSLFIPAVNKVVNVVGAVMSNGSFTYIDKMDYRNYVEMAGGYAKYADEGSIFTLKADGSAMKLSRKSIEWNPFRSRWEATAFGGEIKAIEPGDSIVVPEKLERIAWLRELKDWTQILMNTAVVAGVTFNLFK
jgi:polysaccharide biosynthesis/export protein